MCSQTVAETSKFTNIWKRFWTPLQIDCGMLVDDRHGALVGQNDLQADKADMAKIEAAVRAA